MSQIEIEGRPSKQIGPQRTSPLFKIRPREGHSDLVNLSLEHFRRAQELTTYYMGEPEIAIKIPHNDPVWILSLGDLHIGSTSVDYEKITKIREYVLSHPNVGVIFLGDIIEGIKPEYLRTNVVNTPIPFSTQISLARQWLLEPLAKQGKILAITSDYFAHEGWADQMLTISPWLEMIRGLRGVRILRNGGLIKMKFLNRHQEVFQAYHLTRRKSSLDPLHGLTKVAQIYSSANRPDVFWAGHIHRVAVGRENYDEGSSCLVQCGTWKGTGVIPDPLGVASGMAKPDLGGQGVIIQTRRRGKPQKKPLPTYSFREGQVVHNALGLLDRTEQQGLTPELTERILKETETTIVFQSRRSRRVKMPYKETRERKAIKPDRGYAPQYEKLSYRILTPLPIVVTLIAGTRLGTTSADPKRIETIINNLKGNPQGAALLLGNIIDRQVATDKNRLTVLKDTAALFKPIRNQTLALLLDTNLRDNRWKKRVGKSEEGLPIPPGTYLSQELKRLPLISNRSIVSLSIKSPTSERPTLYSIGVLDHLGHRGSTAKATAGLRSVYKTLPTKPGILVGGHMPLSGETTTYDRLNPETRWPHFIAPGWLASTASWGSKANETPGGPGGLGIILMPDRYLSIPTNSLEETRYLYRALMISEGIQALGISEKALTQKSP